MQTYFLFYLNILLSQNIEFLSAHMGDERPWGNVSLLKMSGTVYSHQRTQGQNKKKCWNVKKYMRFIQEFIPYGIVYFFLKWFQESYFSANSL